MQQQKCLQTKLRSPLLSEYPSHSSMALGKYYFLKWFLNINSSVPWQLVSWEDPLVNKVVKLAYLMLSLPWIMECKSLRQSRWALPGGADKLASLLSLIPEKAIQQSLYIDLRPNSWMLYSLNIPSLVWSDQTTLAYFSIGQMIPLCAINVVAESGTFVVFLS